MLDKMDQQICPSCQFAFAQEFSFCPRCGKQVKEASVTITVGKQISLYLVSFFLPPLGLWPGIKYILNSDPATKKVGAIAIILTIVSILLTLLIAGSVMQEYSKVLNTQVNQYQGLGL